MDADLFERHLMAIAGLLEHHHYVFISGRQMTHMLETNVDEVIRFKKCWNNLELDRYISEGAMYRHRRYGQFTKRATLEELTLLPHQPFYQPKCFNSISGGIERSFAPLTQTFVRSPVLNKLLLLLSVIFDLVESKPTDWVIGVHPQRIVADGVKQGLSTPEGLHRNGVSYIASMLLKRNNVAGGDTTVTDSKHNLLECLALDNPLDMVLADDRHTMHEVSPITSLCRERCAYRDVLVVTFTKMENKYDSHNGSTEKRNFQATVN
ncbi:2OG-Fe dioxygenase family protein [Vibrio sp. TRT 1302]|uniref:2OG-Fe dioxygenase family protein n=1 Tax=Vibrio sp. TRT 1302 TaxID=3418504 RepID=UPI003CF12401